MYQSIVEIQNAFQQRNLKHSVDQVGEDWVLRAGVNGKASSYTFLFIKDDDVGNDVAVRIFDIVKFPPERRDKGLALLNNIGREYRFIRLNMNDAGEVSAQYDFPVEYGNIGEGAIEILIRFTQILDECYPQLMKAIWGDN